MVSKRKPTKSVVTPIPAAPAIPTLEVDICNATWRIKLMTKEQMLGAIAEAQGPGGEPPQNSPVGLTLYQFRTILLWNKGVGPYLLETLFHEVFHAFSEASCSMPQGREGAMDQEYAAETASKFGVWVMQHSDELCDFIQDNLT